MDRTKIKQFLLQLSAEAGEYLRNNFYTVKNTAERAMGGVVTNVDLQLEATMVRRIQEQFPEHGIIVVGGQTIREGTDSVWIIDPLDGSSHFSRNIPLFTSTVAFQEQGETVLGTVNSAQTKQLFFAERGAGAYLNGIEIKVSAQSDLAQAVVFVELPEQKFVNQPDATAKFDEHMKILSALIKNTAQVETFRIGSLGQCLVAAGAFDAYIDLSGSSLALSQAASTLILEEAGAVVTNINPPRDGFVQVLASHPNLQTKLHDIIKHAASG